MKKIFFSASSILIILLLFLISILSTIGYETNRFNNFITEKISANNKEINLKLEKIKFKFDIKNFKLFLETKNPDLVYQKVEIPIDIVKTYLNFLSLINSKPKIDKISLSLKEIDIEQLKKIIIKAKPSNLNSLIVNKVNNGKIKINIEIFFHENFNLKNFIARGKVKNMDATFIENLEIKNTNFDFFADPTDVLIKNINTKIDGIEVKEGNLQLKREQEVKIKSDFISKINLNIDNIDKFLPLTKNLKFFNKKTTINGSVENFFDITFDKTFKVKDYSYKNRGNIKKASFYLDRPFQNLFLKEPISTFDLKDIVFNSHFNSEKKDKLFFSGIYSTDKKKFQKFDFKNNLINKNSNINLFLEVDQELKFDLINFKKDKNRVAVIKLDFIKQKNMFKINEFNYSEDNNSILVKDLKINKNKLSSIKKIKVKTYNLNRIKNNFNVEFGDKILIFGEKYDAKNINKLLNKKTNNDFLNSINKEIDIDLSNIETPLSKTLKNFRLIGEIKNGEFIKISSKGDFGNNKHLDISLINDKLNKKKFLEIYSDVPQPLLSEYSFFKGLSGGVMNFSSIIEKDLSTSKLVFENFKVVNAPGVVKLLSLADFGGLADLAEGEGISFDKMEINLSNEKGFLNLNELYAVGPSISVLMEGYKDEKSLTSLRGTLVPAKNLNRLLAKIPVIGKIIIPDEIGEGLFGVSFKMKGMPGKIKTSINPIKTLTPRFITKALEKSKETK